VAEATLTAETVETPSEEVAVVTPDSPTESVPAPENVEVASPVDAILESIGSASAENAGDHGANATPNEVVPPAVQGPTPDQIRQEERERVQNENRVNGLRWVVAEDAPAQLAKLEAELSDDGRKILQNEINRIKGAFEPLLARAVEVDTKLAPGIRSAALKEAEDFTLASFATSAKEELGEAAFKALTETRHASWVGVGKLLIQEARKGYVPSADYVSKASAKAQLDKLETALKDRGASGIVTRSLAELTGSTGPDTPAATSGSGVGSLNTTQALDRAYGNQQITAAQYKAGYVKLTGREP
jgi:hypothetical protein